MAPKIRIIVIVLIGAAAVYFGLQKFSGPDIPEEFQALVGRFQQESSVQVDLLWPQPGSTRQLPTAVRWNRAGKVAVDVLEGFQGRLTLNDGMVRLVTSDIRPPIPALNEAGLELYAELLAGFSSSEWKRIDPPQHGVLPARADRHWAAITLPFDWAQGHELQLGISKANGELEAVVIQSTSKPKVAVTYRQFRGGTTTFNVSDGPQMWLVIEEVLWGQPISTDDLDPSQHP